MGRGSGLPRLDQCWRGKSGGRTRQKKKVLRLLFRVSYLLFVSVSLYTHTHTREQWQSGQGRDNPNMDPMSPSQLSKCFGVKGSPLGGWENPEIDGGPSVSLTSTLVASGRRGIHDLTQPNMIGRQTQEVCPGGQDASETDFPRRPTAPLKHSLFSSTSTPFSFHSQ